MKVCFSLKLPNPAEYPFFQWKGWTGCCVWRRKKRNSTPKSVNWWSPAPIFRWETAINLSPLESEFLIAVHGADQWKQLTCAGSFRNATQEFLHTKNNRWRRFLHCISCRHEKTTFSDLPCWIPKTCYSWFSFDYTAVSDDYRQENIEKNQRDRAQKDKQKADQASLKSRTRKPSVQLSSQVL